MSSSPVVLPSLDPDVPETFEFAPLSPELEPMTVARRTDDRSFSESVLHEMDRMMRISSPTSSRMLLDQVYRSWEDAQSQEPFRFLDLPYDIRFQVYELLLRPGDVFVNCKPNKLEHDVRFKSRVIQRSRSTTWPSRKNL